MGDMPRIVLAVLGCYRLCELVAVDDGPYQVFAKLRSALDAAGTRQGTFAYNLAELFSCPYCLGIWFSVLCTFLVFYRVDAMLVFLGIAGGQCALRDLTAGRVV